MKQPSNKKIKQQSLERHHPYADDTMNHSFNFSKETEVDKFTKEAEEYCRQQEKRFEYSSSSYLPTNANGNNSSNSNNNSNDDMLQQLQFLHKRNIELSNECKKFWDEMQNNSSVCLTLVESAQEEARLARDKYSALLLKYDKLRLAHQNYCEIVTRITNE